MSGLQVFDALLQCESPIVVLFLSGTGTIADAVDATRKGAFGWLVKPCTDTELLEKIDGALAQAARLVAPVHPLPAYGNGRSGPWAPWARAVR